MITESYEVLSPVGEPGVDEAPSATRLGTLNGKTVALLSNGMFRADLVLSAVAEQVRLRYPDATIIPWTEFPQLSAMGEVESGVRELTRRLTALRPDAVVSSTGA